jgi:tRNA(Ile2) C34 agmatinyltransferase TiaS
MNDDKWRDSYDAWKLAGPYDDDEDVCPQCEGDPDYHMNNDGFPCPICGERAPEIDFDRLYEEWLERARTEGQS